MNWPEIVRELCEGYMGLNPLVIEQMHVDQLLLLMCDKKLLSGKPRTVTASPQELRARGLLDSLPEMSYVQSVRKKMAEDAAKKQQEEDALTRRRAKRERRRRLRASKGTRAAKD